MAPARCYPRRAVGGKLSSGSRTLLMTWMTPFDCMTFGMVTSALSPLASMTQRWPRAARKGELFALDGLHHRFAAALLDHGVDVAFGQATRHDMVGQHRGQHLFVFGLQ